MLTSTLSYPLAAFALLIAALSAGCSSTTDPAAPAGWQESKAGLYRGRFVPDPDPPVVGQGSLDITLEDQHRSSVDGASLSVDPWMPAHGHGSSAVPVVDGSPGGHYHVRELVYTMPGRWELRIHVDSSAGSDEFAVELDVQ